MEKKQIIAISVVAVVIIAAIGAAIALMGNTGTSDNSGSTLGKHLIESEYPSTSSRLWVYGNANEDDKIDGADVTYLQGIIDGETSTTTLADANCDGVIDKKDKDY